MGGRIGSLFCVVPSPLEVLPRAWPASPPPVASCLVLSFADDCAAQDCPSRATAGYDTLAPPVTPLPHLSLGVTFAYSLLLRVRDGAERALAVGVGFLVPLPAELVERTPRAHLGEFTWVSQAFAASAASWPGWTVNP